MRTELEYQREIIELKRRLSNASDTIGGFQDGLEEMFNLPKHSCSFFSFFKRAYIKEHPLIASSQDDLCSFCGYLLPDHEDSCTHKIPPPPKK